MTSTGVFFKFTEALWIVIQRMKSLVNFHEKWRCFGLLLSVYSLTQR